MGIQASEVVPHGSLPVSEWSPLAQALLHSLPFTLTAGQMSAAAQILFDLQRPLPMNRLLQVHTFILSVLFVLLHSSASLSTVSH